MKVLLTVHQFFPDHASGTEVLTLEVAQELRRRGHEVEIFTGFPSKERLPDDARFDAYEVDGLLVHRFRHSYAPMGDQDAVAEIEYNNLLAARRFTRLLAETHPDVVHFFHFGRLGAGAIDAAVHAGVPAYYTPTDFWFACPMHRLTLTGGRPCAGPTRLAGNCVKHLAERTRGPLVGRVSRGLPDPVADVVVDLTRRFCPTTLLGRNMAALGRRRSFVTTRLNWLNGIASPTRIMTEALVRSGVDQRLVHQIAYGIGHPRGVPAPLAEERSPPLTVGFIGTLAPHKGCHVLLDAVRGLPEGSMRLLIYGNLKEFPSYGAELERRAGTHPDIRFCGTFPHDEIDEILSRLDALVVPSLWSENTPLVAHAALGAARPVIASDQPGLTEAVVDGENGLVFPSGDVAALRRVLSRIAVERGLLARLSANCRPPKSTADYVDDLLALYGRPRPIDPRERDLRDLQPLPA